MRGWTEVEADTLRVFRSGQGAYIGKGYGNRRGYWVAQGLTLATDTLIDTLLVLLEAERRDYLRRYPPDAVTICEVGPAENFILVVRDSVQRYGRNCTSSNVDIGNRLNEFIWRQPWREVADSALR